ncbi:hypothetical protein [Pseudoalteromonas nigrifaciens]|uniref:hypothetical protein n=1 Tax=Pseudoalteromonas nigrifaciens TaxID=28109 RepID=UPI003FD65F10
MKYIKVNRETTPIKQEGWEDTYNSFSSALHDIPCVKSGTTTLDQAKEWLECVSKVHTEKMVATCIKQSMGFGARDIRALSAFDNGEYYPALSANEIYQSKQLKAFPATFTLAKNEEPFIINAVRQVLAEKHNVERKPDVESAMLDGNGENWLRSRPSLYGTVNGRDVIVDIHINRGADITHSDEIRLHYHDLVATTVGKSPASLFQANIQIDRNLKEQLVNVAKVSPAAEKAAIELVKEAITSSSNDASLSLRIIQKNQDTFDNIAILGEQHWQSVLKGAHMDTDSTIDTLPDELNDEYTQLSKRIVVAQSLKNKAAEIESTARNDMADFAARNDINSNVKLPYEATTLKQSKNYNLDALFDVLTTKLNVPSTSLKKATIDTDIHMHLHTEAVNSGTSITPEQMLSAVKYGALDEASIKTAAKDAGLNLNDYVETSMRVYMSPQSRGDVHNALQNIRSEIDKVVTNTVDNLIETPSLDDERLKQNLSNTGISHHMDF